MHGTRFMAIVLGGMVLGGGALAGDQLLPVDIRNVALGGEVGRRIDVTIDNNLLVLDVDGDFLKPFQERVKSGGYVGLGKLIDAEVRLAVYSGNKDLLERKQYTVRQILATQEADGYIGMMAPEHRMWALWDIYEMAYLIYGLTMDYKFFDDEASLKGARGAADYIVKRWSAEPEKVPGDNGITEYMAVTGLENALLALHDATGDARYLDFCLGRRGLAEWDGPIVLGRWGQIQGHAYAYLCRSIAQVRLYRTRENEALLRPTRRAMDFLTKEDGLSITGTCGQHECWHDTQEGIANLGETCATAYLIRFLDELIRLEGDPRYGDLMERAIYNALFAAQSPDGRKIRYYSPFEGPRKYFDGDTYCCPCNYRRIIAELPGMVCYETVENPIDTPACMRPGGSLEYHEPGKGLTINLYTPGTVRHTVEGVPVTLTMETDYPSSGTVTIKVDPAKKLDFAVRLRIPKWCAEASIKVNGEPYDVPAKGGTFVQVCVHGWEPGDIITLEMPMALRLVKGRKAQAGRVAVMYGPQVFCLNPARNEALKGENLRALTLDPSSLSGPFPDDSVRPGGLMCKIKAWRTTSWYPHGRPEFELVLTEFPDPGGEAAYFHVPNPNDAVLVEDELVE